MSSGLRKNSSPVSGIISRVRGISITPSMITRETCRPPGPTCFAIDWARARCEALAEVTAVKFAPCFTDADARSDEHTSELQSQFHLVCRLLLEKKKKTNNNIVYNIPQVLK